jgi:hypothetical protein
MSILEEYPQIRQKWNQAKQGHVFKFWDKLNLQEKETLLTQLKVRDYLFSLIEF